MKQFLLKIALFIVLIFGLNQFLLLFSSYHWGNPWYTSKIEYLESKDLKLPNTFFLGSSRFYRQIDPRVFNELYNETFHDKRESFNLGSPATFCPETYYLYERFIKSEIANDVDLIFMELMPVNSISKNLMLQERTTYWQNLSDLNFAYASFSKNSDMRLTEKIKSFRDYFICYTYNLFDFGHLKKSIFNHEVNLTYIGPDNNGYYSLDNNLSTTRDEIVRNDLIQRKKRFDSDSMILRKRALNLIDYHTHINNEFDKVNLQRILTLIDISKKHGIKLVFVLPQIVLDNNLINLSKEIPKANLIDLSNPEKYPQLYDKKNVFDFGHLNSNGAKVFTELLVNQYIKMRKVI